MSFDISIGSWKVNSLLYCKVIRDADKLSDIATIILPGVAYNKTLEIESKIKRGDPVNIKLGYNSNFNQEFSGFISSIGTDDTITIECEDGMYSFRKSVQNKQYISVTVGEIIQSVVNQIGGYTVVIGEGVEAVRYDKFTVSNATAYEVFKKIKDETSLHIFIIDRIVYVNLKYTFKSGDVVYDFAQNVEDISLKYVNEADKKVLVEVIGINRKNEKKKVIVGEEGGDKITIHRYNVMDESALKIIGQEERKKYCYTGYDGDLNAWLFPYCSYGYSAKIIDPDYPDREGTYYVSAVEVVFDETGGHRKVSLGLKVA